MVTLSRNKKIIITSIIAVALILTVSASFVYAQTPDMTGTKTWTATGNVYQKIDNETIKVYPASFTLQLQASGTNGTAHLFNVVGGTLTLNGVTYTITSGNGALLPGRHVILMQATGTNGDGQALTLKLAARYIWTGPGEFAVRIAAKATVDNTTYGLLMKSTITKAA